jgi:cyclopropane-fatty-acyl-phospholipid synthase
MVAFSEPHRSERESPLRERATGWAVTLSEHGLVPEVLLRGGIRRLLADRLRTEAARQPAFREAWPRTMAKGPIALVPAMANAQHYGVPPAFFQKVLGRQLKYSGCYWPAGVDTLDDAEEAMLKLTADRAQLADGQRILELGCGWGSLSLWMARRFPASTIIAVSNSAQQRGFIEARIRAEGLTNLEVHTADMNQFVPSDAGFDRIVSVEMFEHMRNWEALLQRARGWVKDDGRLFIHVFAHRLYAYPFDSEGDDNWMGRHFFSGGMMPSVDLLDRLSIPFSVVARHTLDGTHYARTAEAWHTNLLAEARNIEALFAADLGRRGAKLQLERWRMFFLACAELFAFRRGGEWVVSHALLAPTGRPGA